MPMCDTCGQPVIRGYLQADRVKGQKAPRTDPILLDPHRQCFAPYEDSDVEKESVRLFWSNARAEHVCVRKEPAA